MTLERGRAGFLLALLAVGAGLLFLSVPSPPKTPRPVATPKSRAVSDLKLPATLDSSLQGGGIRAFRFQLEKGEALAATLENSRDDLIVRLLDPSGAELFRVDSANGLRDGEFLYALAKGAGDHVLEIRSRAAAGKTAHYRLEIDQPHPPSERDLLRAAAMSWFSQGERFFQEGSWRQAVSVYFKALSLWEKSRDSERASATRFRLGRALQGLDQWGPAELVLADALEEVRARRSPVAEARLLDRVGRSRVGSGELDDARSLFQRALELFRQEGYRPGEADVLGNLGVVARRQGDFQGGVKLDFQSLELWGSLGGLEEQSTLLHNLGELYLGYGSPEQALTAFNRSLEIGTKVGSLNGQARALRGKGTAYGQLGQVDLALGSLKSSIELWRHLGDRHNEVVSQVRLGDVFTAADRLLEAQNLYEGALRLSQESDDPLGQGMAMGNLGHLLDLQGHEQEALSYFSKARSVLEGVGELAPLPKIALGEAEALRDLGELGKARLAVEASIRGFESFQGLFQRVAVASDRRASYELYVDILMRLQETALAFEAAEAARFRTLLDDIGKSRAGARSYDPVLVKRKSGLEERLNALELERWGLPEASERVHEIDREVRDLETHLALVRRDLQVRSERELPKSLTLAEIQRSLDRDSLLLVYFLGKDRSFLWEVARDRFRSHQLPGRSKIEPEAMRVHKELSGEATPQDWHGWATALKSVSRLVLSPVADRLKERTLIIDPDGALNLVPFAALLDPRALEEKGRPGDGREGPRFLVLDHETVMVPSVSLIAARREVLVARPPAPGTIAILADPVFDLSDPRVPLRLRSRFPIAEFRRLPRTADEADAILTAVPRSQSFVALGFQATRGVAISPELGRYRILHFATHGWLRDRPDLSGVVLSLVDESGKARDGFLRAFEIYDLDISSDLVVLSACETGLGSEQGGLVRGFLNAGAKQVVATLWRVQDRSTARLMASFYKGYLSQGLSTSAALRQAQLDLVRGSRWNSPHSWAGFVLHGDWR